MRTGWCPGCKRDMPLKRVRPWPDLGISIGECTVCLSTLSAHPELPPVKAARPFTDYLEAQSGGR